MNNVWQKLTEDNKPFFVLAPMAGVTDFPFREILCAIGKPDLFFTEFISTEGVVRNSVGANPCVRPDSGRHGGLPLQYEKQLEFSKKQRPLIAQFFGCKMEQFEYCAELALKLGFDGIDINMGCPDRKVQKQGSGSELIKNPELAIEAIRRVKKVVGDKIPVSVKTRIGYDKKDFSHILAIAKEGVDAITIHGRTAKQGYLGEADWDAIGDIAKKIKKINPSTVVIGNGDVKDVRRGALLCSQYGVDGIMIGRAVLKNPWVFAGKENISSKTRLKTALRHTELFEKFYEGEKGIGLMKKYYKGYLSGTDVKRDLMECKHIEEAKKFIKKALET